MIDDFDNRRKRDFDELPVGAFDFHARRRQRLSCLHTADNPPDARAFTRNDLNIAFAVKRLQRREGFSYFHCFFRVGWWNTTRSDSNPETGRVSEGWTSGNFDATIPSK